MTAHQLVGLLPVAVFALAMYLAYLADRARTRRARRRAAVLAQLQLATWQLRQAETVTRGNAPGSRTRAVDGSAYVTPSRMDALGRVVEGDRRDSA